MDIIIIYNRLWISISKRSKFHNPEELKSSLPLEVDLIQSIFPDFGAMITYYVHETPKTAREQRKTAELEAAKKGLDVTFPSWEALSEEARESSSEVKFLIRDEIGQAVRWLQGKTKKGLQRSMSLML